MIVKKIKSLLINSEFDSYKDHIKNITQNAIRKSGFTDFNVDVSVQHSVYCISIELQSAIDKKKEDRVYDLIMYSSSHHYNVDDTSMIKIIFSATSPAKQNPQNNTNQQQ